MIVFFHPFSSCTSRGVTQTTQKLHYPLRLSVPSADFNSVSDDFGSVGTADTRQQRQQQQLQQLQMRSPGRARAEAPSGVSGFGGAWWRQTSSYIAFLIGRDLHSLLHSPSPPLSHSHLRSVRAPSVQISSPWTTTLVPWQRLTRGGCSSSSSARRRGRGGRTRRAFHQASEVRTEVRGRSPSRLPYPVQPHTFLVVVHSIITKLALLPPLIGLCRLADDW